MIAVTLISGLVMAGCAILYCHEIRRPGDRMIFGLLASVLGPTALCVFGLSFVPAEQWEPRPTVIVITTTEAAK